MISEYQKQKRNTTVKSANRAYFTDENQQRQKPKSTDIWIAGWFNRVNKCPHGGTA
jgi:hypothetical protein